MVPLKNAHLSGAWAWNAERKRAYANDMDDPDHLIAVTSGANRSKGARGPEEWKPPDPGYWCEYARDWIRIKNAWDLTVTSAEWDGLAEMLDTCSEDIVPITPAASAVTSTPIPTQSPTSTNTAVVDSPTATTMPPTATVVSPTFTAVPEASASISIVELDCKSDPERVTIRNSGAAGQDMTGWRMHDEGEKHTYNVGQFVLGAGETVVVFTGKNADPATRLFWKNGNVWNNGGDTAYLYDSAGELVSQRSC